MTMPLLENLFSQSTIERWGWMLVHVLWQAAVVAVLLAVVLRVLRKNGANLRYLIACSALVLMVALPVVTLPLIEVPGPVAEAGPPLTSPLATTAPAVQTTVEIVEEMPAVPQVSSPPTALDVTVRVPLPERIVSTLEPALPYVVLGWLIGVFGLSAWHLGGWAQLQRLKRRMVRQIGDPLQQRLEELTARLGVGRAVGLLESAIVEVPTVVGWLRPVILLPASALTGLSTEQLEAILAHELAHIRRYDYLVNVLQTVVEILGFYHPAVWWVSRRIRIERENCCDDLAVRVCGNSLEYAKALTCMEEIRYSRTGLAVAASGGSLVSRIARLLGRPSVDDRRFAWLPGLVALLLVVGIIIPAALVFATPQPSQIAEPPGPSAETEASDVQATATDVNHDSPAPNAVRVEAESENDPSQDRTLSILVDSSIIKVFSDLQPDRETLLMMANVLGAGSRLTQEVARAGRTPNLTIGEILKGYTVQQPLSDEAGRALIDLLQSRGYLQVLSAPRVLAADGKKVEVRIINEEHFLPQDSDGPASTSIEKTVLSPEKIEFGTIMTVLPRVVDGNRVTLEMMVELADAVPEPQSSGWPIVCRTSAETWVTVPNDRHLIWAAIELPSDAPSAGKGRESVYVMVRPHIVGPGQEPELPTPAMTGQVNLPDGQWVKMRRDYVNSDPMVAELSRNIAALERDLIVSRQTLAEDHPTITQKKTLLEAFQKLLEEKRTELEQEFDERLGQRLAADTQAQTQWQAAERTKISEEHWVRTRRDHVNSDRLFVELSKQIVVLEQNLIESRQTLAENHPTVVGNRELLEAVQKRLEKKRAKLEREFDEGLAERLATSTQVQAGGEKTTKQANTTPASADASLRQVLLDVRTVTTEHSELQNLTVEWAQPTAKAGAVTDPASGMQRGGIPGFGPSGVQLGYTPGRAFTDSLLAALDVLQKNGQAEISSQQIVAQDGCQSRIRAIREERFSLAIPTTGQSSQPQRQLQRIETGTVLSMTPHLGDNNDITLQIGIEVGQSLPRGIGSDLPVVTRRTAKNVVTITDGGTVAVAGLMENPTGGPNDKSAREVVIFVTAHLIRDISGMSVPAPPTTETLVRVPPAGSRPEDAKEATITATFDDRDLRDALQHISTLAGVPIIPDANITGRVTATFKDVPLEVALEIVLAGKPYVFRRTPRCYLVVARTATGNAGNRGSNPRRRQVLLDARVVVME